MPGRAGPLCVLRFKKSEFGVYREDLARLKLLELRSQDYPSLQHSRSPCRAISSWQNSYLKIAEHRSLPIGSVVVPVGDYLIGF